MLSADSVAKIKTLADEVSRREGCLLYDIEFSASPQNRVLRVFIDCETAAVSVDQCANVSRGLSLLLDVQDVIPGGRYELEVSSPGIERPLKEAWHFRKALGSSVKIVTMDAIAGIKGHCKSVSGTLVEGDEAAVTLEGDSEAPFEKITIPLANIKKAQVLFKSIKNEKKR